MNPLQIRGVQMFVMFMLAIGITNHVVVVPLILQAAHRDAWISALCAIPLVVIWVTVIYLIIRLTQQQSLYDWFKSHYNKPVAAILLIPFLLLLLIVIFITVRDSSTWTKVTYLPRTPYGVTVGLFVFAGMLAAMRGLRTIVIASGVLLPFVILFGLFVMTVNFQYKDYSYLFPVLTQGYKPVMQGIPYVLSGMIELIFIVCVQQYLSNKAGLKSLVLWSLGITGLVFGPLMASIAIFGPFEASDQRYPAFEQWRMVAIGKFISHLDFLSIYQWLSGALIKISFSLFLLFDLLRLTHNRFKWLWMLLFCSLLVAVESRWKISDASFFNWMYEVVFPIEFGFFYLFPFLLLTLIYFKRR